LSLRKGESKTGLILLLDCRWEADFRLSVILPCGQMIRAGVYSGIRSARIESISRLTKDFQPPADPLRSLPQGEKLREGSQLQRRVLKPQVIEVAKSMPFSTPATESLTDPGEVREVPLFNQPEPRANIIAGAGPAQRRHSALSFARCA
jgi:hypothetical protein